MGEGDLLNGIYLAPAYCEQFFHAVFDVESSALGRAVMGCRNPEDAGNHPIKSVALDFVRHDRTVEWPVDVLLATLTGCRRLVADWRGQFKDVVETLSREPS